MNRLKHIAVIFAVLFLCLGVPTFYYVDVPALLSGAVDAVTRASMEIPDQPSGEFVVLLNREKHLDTLDQWNVFFSGEDAGVIMSDVACLVAAWDATGIQLAERYQARLPENQMTITRENGLLLASKAELERFDLVILSREVAEAYDLLGVCQRENLLYIPVKGA